MPAAGKAAPPLDDGRVQISLPEDWVWAPRSKDYLIRALPERHARYPSITLYVEPDAEIGDVDQENVLEFSKQVQKNLAAELAPHGLKLAEPVQAVRIGSFFGAEYIRQAKAGAESVERLFLVTVSQGRKYSLELRVLQGSLTKYRDFGLAVAASLQFVPADSARSDAAAP